MLSLALTSDLHLEVRDVAIDAVVSPDLHADVLLLLGDVGDPADDRWMRFMEGVSARFPVVLLLSGNNEYRSSSGRTMADTDALIRQRLAPLRNVHYLSNGVFQIKDVVFIGTTLWWVVSGVSAPEGGEEGQEGVGEKQLAWQAPAGP